MRMCACGAPHDGMTTLWHGAYRRWYDHDRAGHAVRAALWGAWTDLTARLT